MEDNTNQSNGRGVFYAVIGVATLVITIIGATFAYLTATANSAPNAVTATGATITLGYTDVKTGLKQNLIPIDVTLDQFNKGTYTDSQGTKYSFVGIGTNDCRDVNGNNICSVYQFTVSNPESTDKVSQFVYATMEVGANTFTNLKYAVFKGTADEVAASTLGWDVDGTAVTTNTTDYTYTAFTKNASDAARKHVIANKGDLIISKTDLVKDAKTTHNLTPINQLLDDGESMTYTVVLWVDEQKTAQDADQGKDFKATIKFTTATGGKGVSGQLVAAS